MESFLPASSINDLERARDAFLANTRRWRIVYHNDGDGVASASVLAIAMLRLRKGFQLTPFTEVEMEAMKALSNETKGPILVVDTGSSLLPALSRHSDTAIVLDHHKPPGDAVSPGSKVIFVNPHNWGIDGMVDLSASMLTYLFAKFLDPKNVDLVPWGLSGAIADRQHVGGLKGSNLSLVKDAEANEVMARERALLLAGKTMEDALATSLDPYIVGVSGSRDSASRFLQRLGIEGGRTVDSLNADEQERLGGAVLSRLISQGTRPEFCETFVGERYRLPDGGMDANTISLLQNATARENEPSVGIAMAMGDQNALSRAWELERRWREVVLMNLKKVEKEVQKRKALQWFNVTEASLGGAVAGYAINYFLEWTRPAFAMAPRGKMIKVSARGTTWLVSQGLDLDIACREGAKAAGGEGGGHRVASGATIPPGKEEQFLNRADEVIDGQLKGIKRA